MSSTLLIATPAHSSIIGADGGITLWVSYDNVDAPGASVNDNVTQINSTAAASCTPTNNARSAQGAPDSPGSCPAAGGDTCSGRDKLLGDISNLAEYIYTSTHGTHYLRRVYVADRGRAWSTADIKWNIGGGSSAWPAGWKDVDLQLSLNSATRKCIHDVLHHELGHYFYELPDRYARSGDYYKGSLDNGATVFNVDVDEGDPNTVMASNFPHRFVDTTNARLVLSYDQPGPGTTSGEELTPDLLADGNPNNDGPDRAHHGFTTPFAQDEWSVIPGTHVDLAGVHTEGDFSSPGLGAMPAVDVRFIGVDSPFPGTVLLLDRSGSMSVQTNGVPASQYVQEAGLYLYHSSEEGDYAGTFLYNDAVEKLFDYDLYDPANQLPTASFRTASGLTNIALALEEAIDAMIAKHGEGGVNSGQIVLMSDGKQTTGDSLWEQVDRANGLGIQIHTLTFGNADATTMQQIADSSGGSATSMSELDSAAELKLNMVRKLTTLRDNSPIFTHKGIVTKTGESAGKEYFSSEFQVPPKTQNVLFYVFLERNNAANLNIELIDSDGQRWTADRYCRPEPGTTRALQRYPRTRCQSGQVDVPGCRRRQLQRQASPRRQHRDHRLRGQSGTEGTYVARLQEERSKVQAHQGSTGLPISSDKPECRGPYLRRRQTDPDHRYVRRR
ncbi:VWA domain-containing protein [Azotobacter beijerinckii]|uniref:VWA domain-containing protein n=1 Tax=Azotobacter beijerinckii TaxID=170623 RepID=UPI001113ED0B|nr:VWA domain-containing protein [Azotobacter beijerinckii]